MCTLVVESGEPPFEEPFEAPEPPWPEDHAPQDLEWPPDGARQQNSADPRDDQEEDCRRVESGKPCSRESKTRQEPKTVFFHQSVRTRFRHLTPYLPDGQRRPSLEVHRLPIVGDDHGLTDDPWAQSGAGPSFRVIRHRFVFSGKDDEPTPGFRASRKPENGSEPAKPPNTAGHVAKTGNGLDPVKAPG
jgi:hypothetical protein